MSDSILVTNVLENTCLRHTLLAQHGQSFHINYFGSLYLFDVGEVFTGFKHNFDQMGFSVDDLKAVIISHRHIDHAGSLAQLLPLLKQQKLYITDDYGETDLREFSEKYRFVSMREDGKFDVAIDDEVVRSINSYANIELVTEAKEIEKGFFTTGSLGGGMREQSLVIKTEKGIVILVGCSHPKLPTIIEKCKEITNTDKIYGVMGGFHFKDSTREQFSQYIDYLSNQEIQFLAPGHCTGSEAVEELKKRFSGKVHVAGTDSFGTGNSIQLLPELKFNLV